MANWKKQYYHTKDEYPVSPNAKTVYINNYKTDYQFTDGMLAIQNKETGKWGFIDENGNLTPKADYKTKDGYNLGQWIVTQRIQYANKTLNKQRIRKLEEIGMSWLTLRERQWENGFCEAEKY